MAEVSERTKGYFEAIKKNAGYVGGNAGWNTMQEILTKKGHGETELIKAAVYSGYANSSEIEILKYTVDENDRFCAELSYRVDVDDYCIETHIFERIPTRESVLTVREMEKLELDFRLGRADEEFDCWECGRHVHWLDAQGTGLSEKAEATRERYCGC